MNRWVLFVDESGQIPSDWRQPPFHPDECNVSGVLVREERALKEMSAIKEGMKAVLPWMPWPFHQAELRRPIVHLVFLRDFLTTRAGLDYAKLDQSQKSEIVAIAESVQNMEPDAYGWLQDFLKSGGSWSKSNARLLRRASASHGAKWTELLEFIQRRLQSLDAAIERRLGYEKIAVFSCGESEPGDCLDVKGVDPWSRLFIGLVVRVTDSLLAQGDEHHLEIRCANRWLWHEAVQVPAMMSGAGLADYIKEALGSDQARSSIHKDDASVTIKASRPLDYRVDAGPFLVIADRLANTSRHFTASGGTLNQISHKLQRKLPFAEPVYHASVDGVQLPRLTAIGSAAHYVEDERLRTTPPPVAIPTFRGRRQWAKDQASRAATFVREHELTWRTP